MGCTIGGLGGCANGQGEFIREKRKERREKKGVGGSVVRSWGLFGSEV